MIDEVRDTMSDRPRALPPEMAFDAVGHALFARVTASPSFSLARDEATLLRTYRNEILDRAGRPGEIVDLDAGDGTRARPVLDGAGSFVAVETCRAVLDDGVEGLAAAFPSLKVRGIVGNALFGLGSSTPSKEPRLVLLLGSGLARLEPTAARIELVKLRQAMQPQDTLLLGFDLAKGECAMQAAYDDEAGFYAAFSRNALRRANREVGTDFRVDEWRYVAEPQPHRGRVEIRFEARRAIAVSGGRTGMGWDFMPGEPLIVEHAHKPTEGQVAALVLSAGFTLEESWKDDPKGYGLFLLRP